MCNMCICMYNTAGYKMLSVHKSISQAVSQSTLFNEDYTRQ